MTQNNFLPILGQTLGFEGGYVEDHAGPTNYGVTQATYDSYRNKKKLKKKSVKELTTRDIREFYEDEFYKTPGYDRLPPTVSAVIFDYGVNSGTNRATKALQEAVGAKADGILGPKTEKAVLRYVKKNGEQELVKNLIDKREAFLTGLIEGDPDKYKRYTVGWANRIDKLRRKYLSE